jgi:anthranilate phosphoribosyltransferase
MKYAIGPRREMGIRTIFNILGPLTNPAGANCYTMGLFTPELLEPIAGVLNNLGVNQAYVVHGDGLDEIALSDETSVYEVKGGSISKKTVKPEDFGLTRVKKQELKGGDAKVNAGIIRNILDGKEDSKSEAAILNAAFSIAAAGIAPDPAKAISVARDAVKTGKAKQKLEQLIEISNSLGA